MGVAVAGIVVTAIAGTVLARVAALVIPAITLLLSGTTVLAALVTLGTAIAALIAAMMGISDVLEGLQNVYNGAVKNGEKGINLDRDTLFAEKPDDYYMIESLATMGASEGAKMINQYGLDQSRVRKTLF